MMVLGGGAVSYERGNHVSGEVTSVDLGVEAGEALREPCVRRQVPRI